MTIDGSNMAERGKVPGAVRALKEALGSGVPDAALAVLAPGALLWHNADKFEMDAAEGIRRVAGLHELVDDVHVDVIHSEAMSTGWFQRIVLRGRVRGSGRDLAAHNAAVIRLSGDRITRIDEYVDPTMLVQLGV
jgi:ketosteroid isomerase-like protein